jgi:hypothetical protein
MICLCAKEGGLIYVIANWASKLSRSAQVFFPPFLEAICSKLP